MLTKRATFPPFVEDWIVPSAQPVPVCRILSLDGGGAKGFYTLGVLNEIEAMIQPRRLYEHFDLIFGTSTGAIIAALLALGYTVAEVHRLYRTHVPTVMKPWFAYSKSKALQKLATEVFDGKQFTDVLTGIGIVTTRWREERPMIFKGDKAQAHGRKDSFVPGFGCAIADAVRASCSAYPYFNKCTLTTSAGNLIELIDGGYCANNPTLYAIADAVRALRKPLNALRVVSIGVGVYPEPKHWFRFKPTIRIFKNMRTKLVDDGAIANGIAPSYYIEGLLYNVPNDKFVSDESERTYNVLKWLDETKDRSQFVCANEQYYLLRDNLSVCWPKSNGTTFIDAVIKLWNEWSKNDGR